MTNDSGKIVRGIFEGDTIRLEIYENGQKHPFNDSHVLPCTEGDITQIIIGKRLQDYIRQGFAIEDSLRKYIQFSPKRLSF